MTIQIYTDAAVNPAKNMGAWAALIRYTNDRAEHFAGWCRCKNITEMELRAIICALNQIKSSSKIDVFTDCQSLLRPSITKKPKWQHLREHLNRHYAQHDLTLHWIRAHNGHPDNEFVDQLARKTLRKAIWTPNTSIPITGEF